MVFSDLTKNTKSALSFLSGTFNALLEIKDLNKDIQFRDAIVNCLSRINELQITLSELFILHDELQTAYSSLKQKYRELETEQAQLKQIQNDLSQYKPYEISPGNVVLRHQSLSENRNSSVYLCINCGYKNLKSVLQRQKNGDEVRFVCHECNAFFIEKFAKNHIFSF